MAKASAVNRRTIKELKLSDRLFKKRKALEKNCYG